MALEVAPRALDFDVRKVELPVYAEGSWPDAESVSRHWALLLREVTIEGDPGGSLLDRLRDF